MAKKTTIKKDIPAIKGTWDDIIKASVSGNPKPKAHKTKWILVDAPEPIPLTEDILFFYGFAKIKRATYLQDGIEIKKEKDKFYHTSETGQKAHIATVQEMKKAFTDAGKESPETVDY